ncbi:beta-aspartyl-peptidase [Planctobacterium marinum]|uniref:Isoaspartyl dipeptidase n=1 Tax=Planctobacterium marinum TaxID=1631968 RepID=A0AA48HGI6_9ALTE|nr:isoaspartyl dipeptidase [Planctobacterium marinum]
MLTLITNVELYAPAAMGEVDVLVADKRIAAIAPDLKNKITADGTIMEIIDGRGKLMFPGLVDSLVHISGGGGEGGFHTRTPQMNLTDATLGGVTTVIGVLGTDATTRTLSDLLAKAHALETEGISTYCHTGSYQLPARTVLDNVTDDIILIDKFIGIGEIAIADHRSSQLRSSELMRVASEARVGGMISGKAGIVSIHVGDSDSMLYLLHESIEKSDLPVTQFYPTHINRNGALLEAGMEWAKQGGYIDFTASTNEKFIEEGEVPAAKALADCLDSGVAVSQLTMSSDGNASLPVFDDAGELVGLEVGRVGSLYEAFQEAVLEYGVGIVDAISSVTLSPAQLLKLKHKGRIEVGADADFILATKDRLLLEQVYAKGRCMVRGGKALVKGTFEN